VKRSAFHLLVFFVASCLCLGATFGLASEYADFATLMKSPPAKARISKIIHGWPDEPSAAAALLAKLQAQGFGGIVCNVSFTDYLGSEPHWAAFTNAVKAAREAGMTLWLYDEKGYPSAAAGGLVLRDHPEWQAMGLLAAETQGGGSLDLELPPGELMLAAAYRLKDGHLLLNSATNLTASISGRKLAWTAPAGEWKLLAVTRDYLHEGTHAALSLAEHLPYPNLLMREPTSKFLEVTHDRYVARLGPDLGRYFVATFTDEPSLMSLFLKRMPWRVLPWSLELPGAFKKRHGSALEPLLPALFCDALPEGQRARYNYWKTVGDLTASNYFGQIQEWCSRHNIPSSGHLLMEENLTCQVPLYGDFFACLRRFDAPGVDCLTSIPEQVPWFIAKAASSAAELEGRTLVMCETSDHGQVYRPPGDKRPKVIVSEAEIRGTCNRLTVAGVNRITSYYSFADLKDSDLKQLNSWIGRCSAAVTGGHSMANIAVLYPVESLWTRFTPAHQLANESPGASRIESIFHDVSQTLFKNGRDFLYVDGRALTEAEVGTGELQHGELRWKVVILPGADTLPQKAWKNLEQFVRSGGVLISIGALPRNSETEFPAPAVASISRALFTPEALGSHGRSHGDLGAAVYLAAEETSHLSRILDQILSADVQAPNDAPIRWTHRKIDRHHVYFVINDSPERWSGAVRLAARGAGDQWDPASGNSTQIQDPSRVAMELAGYGAAIFRFSEVLPAERWSLRANGLPKLHTQPIATRPPASGRGEFVREQITTIDAPSPRWRTVGTITKSETDTFLFLSFPLSQPDAFVATEALVFETSVPEGQRTPTQLLVILHERGGADYLAHSGRVLSAPGEARITLPLNRFELAGWSSDSNRRLDPDDVTEVRIGWGGYLGKLGEKVEFATSGPQAAKWSAADN
jgi:hypothetical protein